MPYAKPQPYEYEPDDAEELLNGRLQEALEGVHDAGSDDDGLGTGGACTVGFFHETFPKSEDENERVWAFETQAQLVTTDQFDVNRFGIYAINSADAVDHLPD